MMDIWTTDEWQYLNNYLYKEEQMERDALYILYVEIDCRYENVF